VPYKQHHAIFSPKLDIYFLCKGEIYFLSATQRKLVAKSFSDNRKSVTLPLSEAFPSGITTIQKYTH
jgi:hypothetical protein